MNLAPQLQQHQTPIAQRTARILASGQIARGDRDYFLTALLQEVALDDAELAGVQQVMDRLRAGLLRVAI